MTYQSTEIEDTPYRLLLMTYLTLIGCSVNVP